MLEYVQAEPCRTHLPVRRRSTCILRRTVSPDVRVVMSHPASCTVHFRCNLATVRNHSLYQFKKRKMQLRKSGVFRRPVIHLRVDVDRIFAVPHGRETIVPNTLKICGKTSDTARGNKQIPAVGKGKIDQSVIFSSVLNGFKSFIRRNIIPVLALYGKCAAVHKFGNIGDMSFFYLGVAEFFRFIDCLNGIRNIILAIEFRLRSNQHHSICTRMKSSSFDIWITFHSA